MTGRSYGVLIASSRFPDEPKLEDLRCPENDVDGLNDILRSPEHGQFSETLILKNKPQHEVLRNINRVLRQAGRDDLVLIYYSGHGKLNPAGRLHLATVDTVVEELDTTSIPVDRIRSLVDISSSNKIVLILDCCFSGAVGEAFARSGVDDQLQLASGGRGTYILTASTGIQVAQEKESDEYGVFTKHVIEGIRSGEADIDSDGEVSMEDLYRHVHARVRSEGFQEPMKWDLNVRGPLFIARSGKTSREERGRQIREKIIELAAKGLLPDPIISKAFDIIALEPARQTEEQRAYDVLLDRLLQAPSNIGDFINRWYQVVAQSQPKISKSQPAEAVWPEPSKPTPAEPHKEIEAPPEKAIYNSLGMKLVLIPVGTFQMGSPEGESDRFVEEEQYQVTISQPFYLQTTPVTQGQWQQVMGKNPSYFKKCGKNCPVEQVSWDNAQEFIEKLNQMEKTDKYRLPTEAEWEYACRAGSTTTFCFGDDEAELGEYAWYGKNSEGKPHPVGQLKPNVWGLYDMHGNVDEWCQDWWGVYPARPVTDPTGPASGEARLLRGGSWSGLARDTRSANRNLFFPDLGLDNIGFRVARAL